jgi:hypothetical protein
VSATVVAETLFGGRTVASFPSTSERGGDIGIYDVQAGSLAMVCYLLSEVVFNEAGPRLVVVVRHWHWPRKYVGKPHIHFPWQANRFFLVICFFVGQCPSACAKIVAIPGRPAEVV